MSSTAMQHSFLVHSISRASAVALIEAARVAIDAMGIEVAIAVTDPSGHLVAFERTDAAPFLTIEVAIDKAWTVSSFGIGTHVWNAILSDAKVAQLGNRPRMVAVGGGCPIVEGGKFIGAIGISGGNAQQDQDAAEVALRKLGFDVQS